jgi:hypothetical protein
MKESKEGMELIVKVEGGVITLNPQPEPAILSLLVKFLIRRNYHMQFETDARIMTATEIIESCKLTRNEFYHRGRAHGGTGWLLRDTLLSKDEKKKKIERDRNAVSGKISKSYFNSIPVDLRVSIKEKMEHRKIFLKKLKARDEEYNKALRNSFSKGCMNHACNGNSADHAINMV